MGVVALATYSHGCDMSIAQLGAMNEVTYGQMTDPSQEDGGKATYGCGCVREGSNKRYRSTYQHF